MKDKDIETIEEVFQFGGRRFVIKRVRNLDEMVNQVSDKMFAEDERLPYWAELWPSSIALSRYLTEHRELISGKTVLELGCGLGLTSLVLQSMQPSRLVISDYEKPALQAVHAHFKLNDLPQPESLLLDWRRPSIDDQFQRLVASDIVYEERFFQPLIRLFKQLLQRGGLIILAEPSRPVAKAFFSELADSGFVLEQQTEMVHQQGHEIHVGIHLIQRG